MQPREGTQSARKHAAILQAATAVFLDKGYLGASMDEVAALAEVGKQTVYKHFNDKQQLFTEIVLSTVGQADHVVALVADSLADTSDLDHDLAQLARRFLTTLMQPDLLRLRRLVISSAEMFPKLGTTWYERGFERVLTTLTDSFALLAKRGLLTVDDPALAAEHFVGMLLWIPLNKAMFTGNHQPYGQDQLDHHADAATRTFLAAHRSTQLP
jgi:TetR/AcrR family transcriptional repressor of mexJK operon